jgi:hypothetical protein
VRLFEGSSGGRSDTSARPGTVELCARLREGVLCLGVVYRPQPEIAYCYRCGGHEPGALYVRAEGSSRRVSGRRARGPAA